MQVAMVERVSLRVPVEVKSSLEVIARGEGKTMSDFLRETLESRAARGVTRAAA